MIKIFSMLFLLSGAIAGSWVKCAIGEKIVVYFPTVAKKDSLFKSIVYSSANQHCDFSVIIDNYQELLFPKTNEAKAMLLERMLKKRKDSGALISSKKITAGKLSGIEIKSYVMPKQSVKLTQVEKTFFLITGSVFSGVYF